MMIDSEWHGFGYGCPAALVWNTCEPRGRVIRYSTPFSPVPSRLPRSAMKSRTTIRDIAEQAGCHYSTVSLALRGDPKISAVKRQEIQRIAAQLDYSPDPFLSALTAYRSEKITPSNITCLAWLVTSEQRDWGCTSSNYPFYFQGAQSRAEERGYRVEQFWLYEAGMSPQRMGSILYHRGVVGLLLPHSECPKPLSLAWEHFAPVCLGYSTSQPRLHMVAPNEYRNISTIVRETFLRGYRRPALVESAPSVIRFENHWLGAFLTEQFGNPHIETIKPYLFEEWSLSAFSRWMKENRPDVIITRSPRAREGLAQLGYRVPDDVGVASHCIAPGDSGVCGTTKNACEMGKMAVDFVVDMLHRNERGVPTVPRCHLVDGCWVEAGTLRPRPQRAEAGAGSVAGPGP